MNDQMCRGYAPYYYRVNMVDEFRLEYTYRHVRFDTNYEYRDNPIHFIV